MKKVLVFFNSEPVCVESVEQGETEIQREYPNGEKTTLRIMMAGFSSLTGDHTVVCVATDRVLASEDILAIAANKL